MVSERRAFSMHENLLRDVIERQAGTLDKAVLEGVMNLIEAGATKGEITLTSDTLVISDDGKGFATKEEIVEAFEVFGKSDARKQEEKRFARFQIGRGQLFAFGKTCYRTRTFAMTVDLRACTNGVEYTLEEGLPDQPGCVVTVALYDRLDAFHVLDVSRSISRNCKYVDVPLYCNGKQINVDPRSEKWTSETKDAYCRQYPRGHSISVYNLGVFVEQTYGYGSGGVVVSKRQLMLNFARNQVIRSCPVWKRISTLFAAQGEKSLLSLRSFSAEAAGTVLSRLACGEYEGRDVSRRPLFKDTNGKRRSLEDLQRATALSFDSPGSQRADLVMQQTGAIVLNEDHAFCAFNVGSVAEAARELRALAKRLGGAFPEVVPISTLAKGVRDDTTFYRDCDLSVEERAALEVLRHYFEDPWMAARMGINLPLGINLPRPLKVGRRTGALAWTDGGTYIALDRAHLKSHMRTVGGWAVLLSTMAHEYSHLSDERTHDGAFYERYHDLVDGFLAQTGSMFCRYVNAIIRLEGRGLSQMRREARAITAMNGDEASLDENHDAEPPDMEVAAKAPALRGARASNGLACPAGAQEELPLHNE